VWIGRSVTLRYWYGNGHNAMEGKLEDVGDRGIVFRFGKSGKQTTRFYPWNAVLHIEPRGGQGSSSSSDEVTASRGPWSCLGSWESIGPRRPGAVRIAFPPVQMATGPGPG
jgi:hypothetical protein